MMSRVSEFLGRWGAVGGLSLSGLFLTGCFLGRGSADDARFEPVPGVTGPEPAPTVAGAQPTPATPLPVVAGQASPTPLDPAGFEPPLKAGDAIGVIYSDTPVIIPPFDDRIKADGTITLLQNKTFIAAGKTRRQLEQEIHSYYVPSYYQMLTITVKVAESTRFFYVRGDVKAPGRQLYVSRITVLGAIGSAGDFTDFASKTKVQLTRSDGRRFIVNCKKALKDPKLDLEVFPGDHIFVPRRWL